MVWCSAKPRSNIPTAQLTAQKRDDVKAVLQGPSSSSRQHHQQQQQSPASTESQTKTGDKKSSTPNKKRNLLEVFKKPLNAKEIVVDRPRKQHHVLDKIELEYIEALKVKAVHNEHYRDFTAKKKLNISCIMWDSN